MAGYSGTPLLKKLGIKPDQTHLYLNPPENLSALLGELPHGVTLAADREQADVALLFAWQSTDLQPALSDLAKRIAEGGMIWIAWPKKASGYPTDLSGDVVRGAGLGIGWVDIKVCAIDHFWSGLKFVRRRGG